MPTLGERIVASTLPVGETTGASELEGYGEDTGRFGIDWADTEAAIILGDSL